MASFYGTDALTQNKLQNRHITRITHREFFLERGSLALLCFLPGSIVCIQVHPSSRVSTAKQHELAANFLDS